MLRALLAATLACLSLNTNADPAEHLAEAVRFRTISYQDRDQVDYGEFQRFNAFLRNTYPRVFDALDVEVVNGYSLLLHWPGSEPETGAILFTAHSDVVPIEPGTEGDWHHPPFAGVIVDDTVYGRGTLDDKVGIIALLEAATRLVEEGFAPRKNIVLAFGHDEEIGGKEGAAKLAELMRAKGLRFDWMVDEGGMVVTDFPMARGKPVAMINVAEKGYLTVTMVASGEGGHSSRPPKVSTIGRLSRALDKIERNPLKAHLVPTVQAMLETLAPHAGMPTSLVLENLWLTRGMVAGSMADDPLSQPFVRTTTALTMFNAGVKENVVPQRAEARVNFRLLPGDTPEMVIAHVRNVIDDTSIELSYERWNNIPPVADIQGEGYRIIQNASEAVYPEAVVIPSLLTATTDTRHYIDIAKDQYRFQGVQLSSADAKSVHGTNEHISVESMKNAVEVAVLMMQLGAQ